MKSLTRCVKSPSVECSRSDAIAPGSSYPDPGPMPEPSPLFWDHFSARVRDAIDDVAAAAEGNRGSPWLGAVRDARTRWSIAGTVFTVLLVLAGAGVWRPSAPTTPTDSSGSASNAAISEQASATDGEPGELDAIESDSAWGLVRSIADDLPLDDAVIVGLEARPGWAERAVLDLTRDLSNDERRELVQLLQAETKRPGA